MSNISSATIITFRSGERLEVVSGYGHTAYVVTVDNVALVLDEAVIEGCLHQISPVRILH